MKNRIITICMMALAVWTARAADLALQADSRVVLMDKTYIEHVSLEGVDAAQVSGLQCDIVVPEGITIDPSAITLAPERFEGTSHQLTARALDDGRIIVVIVSLGNEPLPGGDGPLFDIPFTSPDQIGTYDIGLNYVVASTPAGRVQAPDASFAVTTSDVTGLGFAEAEDADSQYYNIHGMQVSTPVRGFYIRRQGDNVYKEVVKP